MGMNNGNAHQSAWSAKRSAASTTLKDATPEYWALRHAVICGCGQETECIAEMKRELIA
jgi:hypothetical protein